ncbi:SDR family oxidoreductase [Flammeovirga pectinis]|uniref:SDR family oxidoreductase n=1 Tax=Flammeovirga pectinis TaxID=2494373 RepID=A0A3S9P145_9BACT|nr:SDR family oxidoreductase [Flammeovirga pectinis]AZQ61911.1 SDR family oxidoreductase [Flammeovirga pectinis]
MNVLITGVSKGLGLNIAEKLLSDGYSIYGISRTKSKEVEKLLLEYPSNFHFKSYDLSDGKNIKNELFGQWLRKIPLNAFINNAAMAYDDIITNLNIDKLEFMYKVNVFSPMLITKFVLRNMLLHKNISGSIIHISSISAHTGYKGLSMYASTKSALEGFSKNTAREWGELGVRSNCIVSGFMDTEMSSTLTDDQKNRIYKRTSLKKPVDPNSISNMISFLISDEAKSITGQNLFIDSGTI